MASRDLYPRAIKHLIGEDLLPPFPAVLAVGPGGCGKSTPLGKFADNTLDMSLPGIRLAATEGPDGVLETAAGVVFIDEGQELPEVLGAVKRAVDNDAARQTGRFIVTGSVRARHQATTWPGTGRFIRVRMFGLTQTELETDGRYNPINSFFASDPPRFGPSDLSRNDYLDRIDSSRVRA